MPGLTMHTMEMVDVLAFSWKVQEPGASSGLLVPGGGALKFRLPPTTTPPGEAFP